MRVLLLGGTGAIGKSLKDILVKQGDIVFITFRSSHESEKGVFYLQGDAHDANFMSNVLKKKYDAIVDFMIYKTSEFKEKVDLLLKSTSLYIFISSSRVYANSEYPITESSPRLLDVCTDTNYLKLDEYALVKAREENILFESKKRNWTILRLYITYNSNKLQLCGYEKQVWLYRALNGRSIPLPKDVAKKKTTLTYGGDVAKAISYILRNANIQGEIINITGSESLSWEQILEFYSQIISQSTGFVPDVYAPENCFELSELMGNYYQMKYDRLYNRVFGNSKVKKLCGGMEFTTTEEGIGRCLSECIVTNEWFCEPNYRIEAFINQRMKENTMRKEFRGLDSYLKYLCWRYGENIMKIVR